MDELKELDLNLTVQSNNLYQAIKDGRLEDVKALLKDEKSINDPIVTTGALSGFTALHVACMEIKKDIVEMLVKDYNADVNVVADDGVQPIHLASFFYHRNFHNEPNIVKLLLEFGANANATFGRDIFEKYCKKNCSKWCSDFGEQIPLVTYSIIYNKVRLFFILLPYKPDTEFISLTNKTLVMYALENDLESGLIEKLAGAWKNPNLINHQDNDGRSAIHYLVHPKKYGDFRYDTSQRFSVNEFDKQYSIKSIYDAGGNIYALVNGNPDTFLPNMAAYRGRNNILNMMLPFYRDMSLSRALYFATIPPGDPDKYFRIPEDFDHNFNSEVSLPKLRQRCTELILKDLINRQTFGLPVPEDEVKLMEKLVQTDPDIRNIVNKYKANFINGELKKKVIEFGGKSMTRFEFLCLALNNKKLKLLVRNNEDLENAWTDTSYGFSEDYSYFLELVQERIIFGRRRFELLQELKKVPNLRKALPLPYELILIIVEYLRNDDLEEFIKAFQG